MATAQSKIELIVQATKALNPLRAVKKATAELEKAVQDAKNDIVAFNRTVKKTGTASKAAATGVNVLNASVKRLLGVLAAVGAARFIVVKTAEIQRQQRSLQVLTGSLEEANRIIGELQEFGRVTPFTSSELIETAKRMKAFGFETNQVVDVVKRLSDVAGATGADLGGIATAFGQIQAKGRLQGEELLQLQERGVDLAGQLRKQYGMTQDQFQKALSQGRIGADAVNYALQQLTETGGTYANGAISQSDTLSGKFSTLMDNIESLARKIGTVLAPILDFVLDTSIAIVDAINKALAGPDYASAVKQLKSTNKEIAGLKENIKAMEEAGITLTTPGLPVTGVDGQPLPGSGMSPLARAQGDLTAAEKRQEYLQGRIKQLEAGFMKTEKPKPGEPPKLLDPRSTGTGKGKTEADIRKEQLERVKELTQAESDRQFLLQQSNEKQKLGAQLLVDIAAIKRENTKLDQTELQDLINKKVGTYQLQIQEIDRAEKKKAEDERRIAALQAEQKEAQRLEAVFGSLGQTISTGVTDMIMSAVDGTKSLAETASNMLKNLANQLLQLGLNTMLFSLFPGSSLFKGLPRFASGGSISAGQTSIVGERGPELFTPGRSGSIAPNSSLGATNITVNVSSQGGVSSEGEGADNRRLGEAIGVAVRQELIRQKRPGGLLS